MKKLIFLMLLAFGVTTTVQSQFYVGASAGNSFVNTDISDINGESFKYDGSSFGWKVYAGVGLKSFLGIEGGYRDIGKVKNDANYVKTRGGDVALRGNINLGPIAAFAKAGGFFMKQSSDELNWETSSTNFLWGVGAGLNLGGLGVRLEYENLGAGLSTSSLAQLTLGVSIALGGEK